MVSSYTDAAILAHTPKGEMGRGLSSILIDAATGKLQLKSALDVGPNPAFVVKHPHKNVLYASTERIDADGDVVAIAMDNGDASKLRVLGRVSAQGKSTCYLNIHQSMQYMLAVNYWDAKVNLMQLDAQGNISGVREINMQPGASYVENNRPTREEHWQYRQRWPHSHCIVTEPYASRLHFVSDLGLDKVFVYRVDMVAGAMRLRASVDLVAGRGPRHLVFHPTLRCAFVVNELESSVTVLQYRHIAAFAEGCPSGHAVEMSSFGESKSESILEEMQVISTLPPEWDGCGSINADGVWKAASHASEVRLHPSGKFLYVANRGHDTLAVFRVDDNSGMLALVDYEPTGGKCPRNFNFDRSGRLLLVGNQDSNLVSSFFVDMSSGRLTPADSLSVPSPNYIYAVPTSAEERAPLHDNFIPASNISQEQCKASSPMSLSPMIPQMQIPQFAHVSVVEPATGAAVSLSVPKAA